MKILIILFCLVLLFRHSREPFLGKLKKSFSNVTKTINKNVMQPIKQKTYDPMRDFFLDLRRKQKDAKELLKKKKRLCEKTIRINKYIERIVSMECKNK